MDPLSMTASLITIIQLTAMLASYINDVKNATKEQIQVAVEASNLCSLLLSLRFRVEAAEAARSRDPWFNQVKLLGRERGPLDQFRENLEKMLEQLSGLGKRDHVKSTLMWRFTKTQVDDALKRMERLKTLIQCALSEDLLTLTQAIHEDMGTIGKRMEEFDNRTSRLQTHLNEASQHRVAQWLGIPDPSTNYQAALQKRHLDTGLWLVNGQQFKEWKSSDSSLMWLHGNAGCGKTVLSAAALQDLLQLLESQPDTAVGYFYFDFNDVQKQIWKKAIRSVLFQVASYSSAGQQSLHQLHQRCGNGQQQPSADAIRHLFQETLVLLGSTYIVLDALDECVDREEFLRFLRSLVDLRVPGLHVLATSRRERDIEEQLVPIATYNINVQSAVVDADIGRYIQGRLSTDFKLRKWPDAVRDEISSVLMEKASGMFRWVYCQLESIRQCVRLRGLREALSTLPRTMDQTYEQILKDLETKGQIHDATTILRWLCYSYRPLRAPEICEVLPIETGHNGGFFPEERLPDQADITVICSSLITYSAYAGTGDIITGNHDHGNHIHKKRHGHAVQSDIGKVLLAHFSVKEFLTSERCALQAYFQASTAHKEIAESCLRYLLYITRLTPLTRDSVQQYPLALYAAKYWWQHARNIEGLATCAVLSLALKLLMDEPSALLLWVQLYDIDLSGTNFEARSIGHPIYYAASIGLVELVCTMLRRNVNTTDQGGRYGNALQAASYHGYEKIVQMLLEFGTDINAEGGCYGNALQAASLRSHGRVVQMLLDAGARINAQGGQYGNALQAASYGGNEAVVQVLLDAGGEVNRRGGQYGCALQAASFKGHKDVVQKLLAAGAEVNTDAGEYSNALHAASFCGHEDVTQMLLGVGAEVNTQGGWLGNPLQAAASHGYAEIVNLLLDAGADVNKQGGFFGNALQGAASHGHTRVLHILLDKGANVDAQGGDFNSALQAASFCGVEETVQVLLESGAEVNLEGGCYGSPLQAASAYGHEKVVRILLTAGAKVNIRNGEYGSALRAAMHRGHEPVVRMLLAAGADDFEDTGCVGISP